MRQIQTQLLNIQHSIILMISVIVVSCSSVIEEAETMTELERLNKINPSGKYGKNLNIKIFSNLNDLLSNPSMYLNQDVLIKGEIVDVCPMRGCWIKVKDDISSNTLRVKVTDGLIVFPKSSIGHKVDVQGKFIALNFSEEQAIAWKIHLAEEKGITLNPEDVQIKQSDLVEYRINGTGAKIY